MTDDLDDIPEEFGADWISDERELTRDEFGEAGTALLAWFVNQRIPPSYVVPLLGHVLSLFIPWKWRTAKARQRVVKQFVSALHTALSKSATELDEVREKMRQGMSTEDIKNELRKFQSVNRTRQ